MNPRLLTSVLLFISAYSPLFLILTIKDFDFKCSSSFKHPNISFTILAIVVLSVILLFLTVSHIKRGNMPVTIKRVKNRSIDLINYTIPYIVSFFGFDLAKIDDIISLSVFLFLLLFMTLKSKSVFMNPILLMAGYNLYDLEYTFDNKKFSTIVISKHEMKTGEKYFIRSLTRFLYFVTEPQKLNDEFE